jgi:hypothetical protein
LFRWLAANRTSYSYFEKKTMTQPYSSYTVIRNNLSIDICAMTSLSKQLCFQLVSVGPIPLFFITAHTMFTYFL